MKFLHANPTKMRLLGVVLAALSVCFVLTEHATAQTETVLYTFTGLNDGGVPYAGLISDKDGNLYGTASE